MKRRDEEPSARVLAIDGPAPAIPVETIVAANPVAILIDLDGTIVIGNRLVPGVHALFEAFAGRIAIVSNNSADTSSGIAARLQRMGLSVPGRLIFTAGTLLIDRLAADGGGLRVLPVLSAPMRRLARRRGLNLVATASADVVAVGRDPAFSYASLSTAANAVRRGARMVAANPDPSHPRSGGEICPETGALVAAIVIASGVQPVVEYVGKPQPGLASAALLFLGIEDPRQVIVVGDSLDTDGGLAAGIGARFAAVVRGVGATCDRSVALLGNDPGAALEE